jgi:thiol-disulfide isomerase/thioredoxin
MRRKLIIIILAALWSGQTLAATYKENAIQILTKTVTNLLAMQKVKYRYIREISYVADNYFSKDSADCYFEFDKNVASRFQLNSDNSLQVYNGSEYFSLDKQAKSYELHIQPKQKLFSNFSFFFNSIPALKNALPDVVNNDSVGKSAYDTIIANKAYKVLRLTLHNKVIGYLGGFEHITTKMDFYYDLILDPATYIPIQVIERNSLNKGDHTITTFKDFNTEPVIPGELSWYYSTYTKEYKPAQKAELKPLIAVGTVLKDWELPEYKENDLAVLRSKNLKGKVVIMEFWIKNCGPCMASFPHLKQLQENYKNSAVQVVTINSYDSQKDVGFFYNREKPAYKMLYSGKLLAKELGVNMFPQAIIIDKSGKVVYAGDFGDDSNAQIEKVVESNL